VPAEGGWPVPADGEGPELGTLTAEEPGDWRRAEGNPDDGALVVVEHAATLVEHATVKRLARHLQPADIVREQPLQQRARPRAVQINDAHVRDVENAGVPSHRVVFFELRAETQGQIPAAKIDDLGAL